MDDVRFRDRLRRIVDKEVPTRDNWPAIEERLRDPVRELPTRRRVPVFVTAAVAIVGSLGLLVAAFRPFHGEHSPAAEGPRAPVSLVQRHTRVGPYPQALAAGTGVVWIAVPETDLSDACSGELLRVDLSTDAATKVIKVDGIVVDVAVADGVGWAAVRSSCSAGDGAGNELLRFDPDSGAVSSRITLASDGFIDRVVVGGSTVFGLERSSDGFSSSIVIVDANTDTVKTELPLDGVAKDIEFLDGAAWVYLATDARTLLRIDNEGAIRRIGLPSEIDASPGLGLTVGGGEIAAALNGGDIAMIDPEGNSVTTVRSDGPSAVLGGDATGVWYLNWPIGGAPPILTHASPQGQITSVEVDVQPPVAASVDGPQQAIWLVDGSGEVTLITISSS